MDDVNLAILVDAKAEYTKQLINTLRPSIINELKDIYNESKEECLKNNNPNNTLLTFQLNLSNIAKWNQEVIDKKCNDIVEYSECDWLDELITAVFLSHTRILTSINLTKNKNKIDLKVPQVSHFIHLVYIDIARTFWKNVYLFNDNVSKIEYQQNRNEIEKLIESSILQCIRRKLPVKNILKEYITKDEDIKSLIKKEIQNYSKEKLENLNLTENIKNTEKDSTKDVEEQEAPKVDVEEIDLTKDELVPVKELSLEPKEINLDSLEEIKLDNSIIPEDNNKNNPLKIENLNLEMDDLSVLEEVYIDKNNNSINNSILPIESSESLKINEIVEPKVEKKDDNIKNIILGGTQATSIKNDYDLDTVNYTESESDDNISVKKTRDYSFFN